jgi:hypothetical protein
VVDTTVPYQIVVFTQEHSISGGVFLHDRRLSDFLNDPRDTNIVMRNASVARLDNPAKILEKTAISFVPKAGVVLAFEPPQSAQPATPRFIKYKKERYNVYIIMDGMEARGELHQQGPLDLLRVLADAGQLFVPITQASVSVRANPTLLLKQGAILVNIRRIRFIGEQTPKMPSPGNP